MYDNRTSCRNHCSPGVNLENFIRPFGLGLWGLLWLLCAQVDFLSAQLSFETNKASNNSISQHSVNRGVRIVSAPAGFQYDGNGWGSAGIYQTGGWATPTSYPHNTIGAASPIEWVGFGSGAQNPFYGVSATATHVFSYRLNSSSPTQTYTINLPSQQVQLLWNPFNSSTRHFTLDPVELSFDGSNFSFNDPLVPPPPAPDNLEKFEGKDLTIPYYVEGDAETVEIQIGGQTLTFPVDHAQIEGGGIATLNLPIPNEWDGTATINGVVVALAPRMAYTGSPTMEYYSNPYETPDAPLPVGMTRAILPVPQGMTASAWYSLPAGVSTNPYTTLPFPLGIQSIHVPTMIGGRLPVGVTTTTGTTSWTTSTGGTAPSGTITTGGTNTVTSNPNPLGQEDADAVTDAGLGVPDGDTQAAASLKNFPDRWLAAKSAIENKFGDFQILAQGTIPKASALSFTLPLGMFGERTINLDLQQEPFATARLLALVFVTFWAGMWFFKFLKV